MELLIVIIVIAGIWYATQSKKETKKINMSRELEVPIKISVESSSTSEEYYSNNVVDTGAISQISDDTFCINPKSPLPLTLRGLTFQNASQIKNLLDGEAQWERNLNDLTYLIAQHNIECIELEEFIDKLRLNVNTYIEKRKQESNEWADSSEKDKYDLLYEFQNDSIENLSIKPSNERLLETLLFDRPNNVTADDKLLKLFSKNIDLYTFYIRNLGNSSKANQVPADDYYRKNWETLVELDLAKRGKHIPIEAILDGLRMKDINDYFSDRLDKKFTRKTKAIEFAATQPDVLEILSKHISFRELFQLSEPKDLDISEIRTCYEYASAQAEIIRDTYVTAYNTLDILADAKDAGYDGWEIEAEDCCQECSKLHSKKTKRKPSKLPPFHVGCTCSIEGVYD